MKKPRGALTSLPDGRVVFTPERSSELPTSIERAAPGDLGALLAECRFRARIVVEREDGAPLSAGDVASVDDVLAAAKETFERTDGMLRDLVFLRRTRDAGAREEAAARPPAAASTARKGQRKRAAAKRPASR
ncbi:MAG: hypothetical protein U0324_25845 [Polyangiales bacterium]